MAAECNVTSIVELTGLGRDLSMVDKATSGTTPTAATYNYRVLAAGGAGEALDLGDISTVSFLVIRAIDYSLDVDLDNSAESDAGFDADFTVKAGKPAAVIPNPAGKIWVKNTTGVETPKYEYLLSGTT